jgi:hypothetical protein
MDNQIGKKPFGYIYVSFFPPTKGTPFERFYIGQKKFTEKNRYSFDPNYHGSGKAVYDYIKANPDSKIQTICLIYAYSQEELNVLENYWVSFKLMGKDYPDSFNLRAGGMQAGISEESRHRMCQKRLTEEQKANISRAKKGRPGHPATKETRDKLSKTLKGRCFTEETRARMSKAHIGCPGRPHSDEEKAKMSKALLNSKNVKRLAVVCLETGQVFESSSAAAKFYGASNNKNYIDINSVRGSILKCCKKMMKSTKSTGGHHWIFLDEYTTTKQQILIQSEFDIA